ncbi:PEP-CTERM sorting domain-containing protein [Roseofilum capinflatum]|uniref:PEP-CTERM sorting domain-containing protein n=1 Tax=Roseofilum capinflatum BLCC-M114 TaxID=3022440 RepID=A0ABT7B2K9_9CYAN|nr:PEP-CTERM sorting domain-containing protein [Roseofilum capinflatum]MDJ1173380.1 PEP-CTERM sorting domain-containing protein [Roseofilum capinflatum BLCC-M114]
MLTNQSGISAVSRTVKRVALGVTSVVLCWSGLNLDSKANAAQFSVLWWDTTTHPNAPSPLRQEMSDFLDAFTVDGEDLFDSTYVVDRTPGGLATHLDSHTYDVIVLDTDYFRRDMAFPFGTADQEALKQHYKDKSNLMLDGSFLIRSLNFFPQVDFPGPNNAFGNFTANQVYTIANRGGGIVIGNDDFSHQLDANFMLGAILPGAEFSGASNPSTDGVFYGADLLNSAVAVSPNDIFTNWSSIPNQGVAPTGDFIDFLGNPVTLYSQVDVANKPGGGQKYSYISTSWKPDECTTAVTGTSPACHKKVPEPSALLALLAVGGVGSLLKRR